MLLIFCLNLRKDQQGKPVKYSLARGPIRLGGVQGPNAGKDGTADLYNKICVGLTLKVIILN